MRRLLVAGVLALAVASPVRAQFLATFDEPELKLDPSGLDGWAFFTGDGEAADRRWFSLQRGRRPAAALQPRAMKRSG